MAFATVEDLEARWKPLDDDQQAVAEALLDDAAAIIAATVPIREDDELQAAVLKAVNCSMVKRAMFAADGGTPGITQGSMTADVYTQSWTFSNPSGDLYLSASERRALGVGRGFVSTIPAEIHGVPGWWPCP